VPGRVALLEPDRVLAGGGEGDPVDLVLVDGEDRLLLLLARRLALALDEPQVRTESDEDEEGNAGLPELAHGATFSATR
jgi:hypothetical protein